MEEIAEGLFKIVGSMLRWFIFDILIHVVLFNIGRFTLLLITFGKYPRHEVVERDFNYISWAGVFVIILVWVAIALFNNYG